MNSRYIDTLSALSHLLEQDLERVTYEQEEAARRTIHVKPSNWELILAMKRWAAEVLPVVVMRLFLSERQIHSWLALI